MTEQGYPQSQPPEFGSIYTVVREPISHVLSQYFHCKESRDHARNKNTKTGELLNLQNKMPPLDQWLAAYVEFNDNWSRWTKRERVGNAMKLKSQFRCYDPIDTESTFTRFRPATRDQTGRLLFPLPDNYTFPYHEGGLLPKRHESRDEVTKEIDRELMDDLGSRYQVIGDTAQMTKTICAIFIHFTKGKHIPSVCDCTRVPDPPAQAAGGTFVVPNLHVHPNGIVSSRDPSKNNLFGSRLELGYNARTSSHGVTHHGAAFAEELAPAQKETILSLRRHDVLLYNVSRTVFARQVKELEAKHGITICADWNRPRNGPIRF
mmetsp:Transcript_13168/g.29011  ORF Transcript_13168/g.29011 Transcript_13168/m.29011 type:complete len:320 (-) Transcript_13168:610-1569(-)